jgi:ribosomal-protein-alanine N-acetyltransferase
LDSPIILYLRSDKIINKYILRPENSQTKNNIDAINHIKKLTHQIENNSSVSWGITLKNNPKIIGTICLWNFSNNNIIAEVGYDLIPEFQKKGIMNEALNKVIDFGFNNLNLNKIEAYTHFQNENSKLLLSKNKFSLVKDINNSHNLFYELINNSK